MKNILRKSAIVILSLVARATSASQILPTFLAEVNPELIFASGFLVIEFTKDPRVLRGTHLLAIGLSAAYPVYS